MAVLVLAAIIAVAEIISLAKNYSQGRVKGASTDYLKQAAASLAQGESAGEPVTLAFQNKYYNFVPFELNGALTSFPGVMLDNKGQPVSDELTLKELYRYPGLIKRFADNAANFNNVAVNKTAAVKQYCEIVKRQEKKLADLYRTGAVWGVIYDGTKLAYDAADMVSSLASGGLAGLIKNLAQNKAQELIISSLSKADMKEVMTSARIASEAAKRASSACQDGMNAWRILSNSKSGKISTLVAYQATDAMAKLFKHEASAVANLRDGLTQINEYPRILTRIGQKQYDNGIVNLNQLVKKLEQERDWWLQEKQDASEFLSDWSAEQKSRIDSLKAKSSEPVVSAPNQETTPPPSSHLTSCQSLDLSRDYQTYYYYDSQFSCTSYTRAAQSSKFTIGCKPDTARWREHYTKAVDVAGLNKVRLKADLGLKDYRRFFGAGVKYDNYVGLWVYGSDPTATLSQECNRSYTQETVSKCAVANWTISNLGMCGVAKYTDSKTCDFTVDAAGLDKIYLVFYTSDAWPAELEGTLANLQVCPAE